MPVMSFYLERSVSLLPLRLVTYISSVFRHITDQGSATKAAGGILTLGGTNSSLFTGAIDYVNIPNTVSAGFWLLPVSGRIHNMRCVLSLNVML